MVDSIIHKCGLSWSNYEISFVLIGPDQKLAMRLRTIAMPLLALTLGWSA